MTIKNILVVDDDPSITTLLKYNLEREGYDVSIVYDGQIALDKVATKEFDLVIFDFKLLLLNGVEIISRIRSGQNHTPILLLVKKEDVTDTIEELGISVDEYLTKPFSPKELILKIQAISRNGNRTTLKKNMDEEERLVVGELVVCPKKHRILKNNVEIFLTNKEFELLVYFMERKNRVIDRETLIRTVWNEELYDNTRMVDIHIDHIREKIENNPKSPDYLKTVRGFGYKFQEPDE